MVTRLLVLVTAAIPEPTGGDTIRLKKEYCRAWLAYKTPEAAENYQQSKRCTALAVEEAKPDGEGGVSVSLGLGYNGVDGWIRVASAVIRTLYQSTVVKRDLSRKVSCTAAEVHLVHRTIQMYTSHIFRSQLLTRAS